MTDEIGFKDCAIFFLEIEKEATALGKLKYYIKDDSIVLPPSKSS